MKSTILSFNHCSSVGDHESWYDSRLDMIASGFCVAIHDQESGDGAYLAEGDTLEDAQEVFREVLLRKGYNPADYGL